MDAGVRRLVWQRAKNRCEYCRMQQEFDVLTFQVEHVIPRKHRGSDDAENLALACFACNNHKGTNLSGLEPDTGEMTRLFHPRQDEWSEHFQWQQGRLLGRTAIGRVTVDVLAINLPHRLELRLALMEEGVFPKQGSNHSLDPGDFTWRPITGPAGCRGGFGAGIQAGG